MRNGSAITVYIESLPEKEKFEYPESIIETIIPIPTEEPAVDLLCIDTLANSNVYISKPLFALKSNLLFDAALLPNVEFEVPIRNKWSILGEWMFPWYLSGDNSKALEVLMGSIEGRYWFGNRQNKSALTGFFLGIYAGGGLYDVRYKGKGYQGEFLISSGITSGYSLRVCDQLNFEFSLGFGFMRSKYEYYIAENNYHDLIWQNDGIFNWIGPTKAKVSLVWLFNKKVRGRN